MSTMKWCRKAAARLLFGDAYLPQAFSIGLPDPQQEIAVWLHGRRERADVTNRHAMACADPFTVCIGLDDDDEAFRVNDGEMVLRFCERGGDNRVLAEIVLDPNATTVEVGSGRRLFLFRARQSRNYCLSTRHLLAHYCRYRYWLWRKLDVPGSRMSFLERRAVMAMFIRPHPVVLVSLCGEDGGNMFPMNIMGNLGGGYYLLALKESKMAAHLVETAGRVAMSNVMNSIEVQACDGSQE